MGERRLPAPSSRSLRRIFLKPCEMIALAIFITLFVAILLPVLPETRCGAAAELGLQRPAGPPNVEK